MSFIVFDGPDGVGKDTQINKLIRYLKKNNYNFCCCKDPSPKSANNIRNILLNNDMEYNTRLLLHLASRIELIKKEIEPALKNNKIVICNRFSLTTYAYQGLFYPKEKIDKLNELLDINIKPDLYIVYLSKSSFRNKSENRMDDYCESNRNFIIKKYIELSKFEELNIKLIWVDGKSIEQIFKETLNIIKNKLNG